jgi:hypothetical protein
VKKIVAQPMKTQTIDHWLGPEPALDFFEHLARRVVFLLPTYATFSSSSNRKFLTF